jgi:hypothetical protein
MEKMRAAGLAVALGLIAAAGPAMAIDGTAGDYTYPGDGVKLLLLYGQYQSADSFNLDGAGEVPDSKLSLTFGLLRGVSYQDIAGMKTALQFFVPVAHFNNARIGGGVPGTSGGLGDLTIGATIYPLTSNEPNGTTVGATLFVTMPTGNYELGQPSIGSGSWSVTPQFALQQGLSRGFFWDSYVDATFTKSREHDGVEVSTDPSYQLQTYLRYQLSPTTALAVGYSAKRGGKQSLDDAYAGTKTDSDQIRLQANTFISATTQVQLLLGKDVSAEGGFENDIVAQARIGLVF